MVQFLVDRDNEIPSVSRYFTSSKHLDLIAAQASPNRTKRIIERIHDDDALLVSSKRVSQI